MNKLLKACDSWAEIHDCYLQELAPPYTKYIVSYFKEVVGMVSSSESITFHATCCHVQVGPKIELPSQIVNFMLE